MALYRTAVCAPGHDQSFTQLFKSSVGLTTAALTSNVPLYRRHKSSAPLASRTFFVRSQPFGILCFCRKKVLLLFVQDQQNTLKAAADLHVHELCAAARSHVSSGRPRTFIWIIQMKQAHLKSNVLCIKSWRCEQLWIWISVFTTCLGLCLLSN